MKPNIMIVVNRLSRGGAEKQLYNIVKGLSHRFDFHILTLEGQGELDDNFKAIPVPVVNVHMRGALFSLRSIKNILEIMKYVTKVNPLVIHSWLFRSNLIGALVKVLMRNKTVKLIVTKRGSNHWYRSKHFFINRVIYNWLSDLIMVNTSSLKNEILQYCPVKDKIRIIPNGIDIKLGVC